MAELKPWFEVARPHRDIESGAFDEALFAADLGLVAEGRGPEDYREPELFAEKTYLTENLKSALAAIGDRLAGEDTTSVFRMQTEFGGGKTHTLLAAYHLFGTPERVAKTRLGRDLAAALKGGVLPKARVAVLDGSALGVVPEEVAPGIRIHSFLGHLAWRLGGADLYEFVRTQDEDLIGTSTVEMVRLLEAAAPCLILIDEGVEYLSKALAVHSLDSNLATTTLTVIKELCTAAANVKGAAVLATLTASHIEDYSTLAAEDLQQRLSLVVGRIESIVTPVEGDDIFPILHTRLFQTIGPVDVRRQLADAYGAWYESVGDALPQSFRDPDYRDRIENAYPFHPELIDILTNRWGSLSGFQRTRGALRTLAHTVKTLAQRGHQALLIHPGDVPLEDEFVRAEVLKFAGDSYKAALNADIIRPDSKAVLEDQRRGGAVEVHRTAVGLATTAFLNSFSSDKVVGASAPQMLVGVGRPNPALSKGILDDVRDALAASLWYMRYEGGRYRFTTEPNLNKVIVEREGAIGEDRIVELLYAAIGPVAPSPSPPFRVKPDVTESKDLPDEPRLALGLLGFQHTIGTEQTDDTKRIASEVLESHGGANRANRNAVVLMAADRAGMLKTRQTARSLAALRDIQQDKARLQRFNKEQKEQLDERLRAAEERLPQQLTQAYRHLLLLGSSNGSEGIRVDHFDLGPARADDTIPGRAIEYLRSTDRLLTDALAPAALLTDRFGLIAPADDAVEIDRLTTAFYRLPRLPKLADADVLRRCLVQGVTTGLFGLASGSSWDASDSVLRYREPVDLGEIQFQPGTWLVRASAAQRLLEERRPTLDVGSPATGAVDSGAVVDDAEPSPYSDEGDQQPTGGQVTRGRAVSPTQVTVHLAGVPAHKVRDVVRVAVVPLASTGADVTVDFKVTASHPDGIPQSTLDLVVTEGLRQLGVENDVKTE